MKKRSAISKMFMVKKIQSFKNVVKSESNSQMILLKYWTGLERSIREVICFVEAFFSFFRVGDRRIAY